MNRVCFFGGARYRQPLDATDRKKFAALAGLGEVFVVGFAQGTRPRRFSEQAHFYLLPEIPLRFVRYLEMWILGALIVLWLILRHEVRLIVAQSPYEAVAPAVIKKIAGWFGRRIFLVVEAHGDFAGSVFLERRIRFANFYRDLMALGARFSLRHADLLRAISSATQAQLRRWAPGKPVVQFPAWTDMNVFRRAARATQDPDSQRILYAGVLTPLKGVDRLIDGFAVIAGEFPESRLLIVGRRQNKTYADALRRQVSLLGLEGRVEFRPAVAQVELAALMSSAAAVVLPSASEGLGRVLIEAMAAATPVIGTAVGGIPDLIENCVNGFLIPPNDPQALAKRLAWILENPRPARAMGQAGQAFADEFFSTEVYLNGYRKIIHHAHSDNASRQHAIAHF